MTLLTLALVAASGVVIARWLDSEAQGAVLVAEGFLAGGALAALTLAVVWSRVALIAVLALAAAAGVWRVRFSRPRAIAVHACTAGVAAWHLAYASRADLWDWTEWLITRRDFFFIWGYKARLFFFEHGIPWKFLASLPRDFAHPDYPLLVPLLFDIQPVLTDSWQPAPIAALDTALGCALLVIAHRALRDDFDPLFTAAATLALSGSALLPWVGFAEGPLVAYGGAAALLVRRATRGRRESLPFAVLVLAAAAMTKNEGMALAVSIAIALLLTTRELLPRLWPAAAVIAAWIAARASLGVPTDLFTGSIASRVVSNLAEFPRAFATVPTYQPIVWLASLIAIALSAREHLRREAFLLTTAAVQLLFYLGAYAITPLDVVGHVNGSWPRLTSHVTILVGFAGATSIGTLLGRGAR